MDDSLNLLFTRNLLSHFSADGVKFAWQQGMIENESRTGLDVYSQKNSIFRATHLLRFTGSREGGDDFFKRNVYPSGRELAVVWLLTN